MLGISESQFQQQVIDLAKLRGWLVHGERVGRTAKGWRTPIQGHKGFPDLVLVHPERGVLIFVELKSEKGRLRPDQRMWMLALSFGYSYEVWRPSDWPEIVEILEGASDE